MGARASGRRIACTILATFGMVAPALGDSADLRSTAGPVQETPEQVVQQEFGRLCESMTSGTNLYYGTQQVSLLEDALAEASEPLQEIELRRQLARELLRPNYEALVPNLMHRNDGGERFRDVTFSGGFGHLQKGHGVAFADIDNDGDQDVFEQMGGAFRGDKAHSTLYRNPGHDRPWLRLELVGRRSNRSAIGGRVKVTAATPEGPRTFFRTINSGGSFGGSPLRLELGLGDATSVQAIDVWWPASGSRQRLLGPGLNRSYRLAETLP